MNSRDFCYWLQGYFELANSDGTPVLSPKKVECIQNHLNMVFHHEIDPSFGGPGKQKALSQLHKGQGNLDDLLRVSSTDVEINC